MKEQEQIDIEYKFFFGDLVQVCGYGTDLFKVVGFRTEIWRYKEDAWEDVIYELYKVSDGEWLEASEEELTLVADANSAEIIIQKLGLNVMNKKLNPLKLVKPQNKTKNADFQVLDRKEEKKTFIDDLLDIYNDYYILYEWFKDEEYNQVLKVVLKKLESIVENNNDKKSL